jgi:hypothetical protein
MTDASAFSAQPSTSFMSVNTAVVQELEREIPQSKQKPYLELSEEEHLAVIEKLCAVVKQPAGHLPVQDELYLEQQLTDTLGFEVSAELDDQRLNHSIGTMAALPHLRRFPTDTLAQHEDYREAGLSQYRSAFGWFTELGQMTPETKLREQYYVAVQAQFVPTWHENYRQLKEWYKFHKMVVINPMEQKAVVAVIGDLGPAHWMQYQFGGSPAVIRDADIWSLKSKGKVFLLFVNDPSDAISPGPISLRYEDLLRRFSQS